MAANPMFKGPYGWMQWKKTGGQTSTGPALSTVYFAPTPAVNPRNPDNISYPPVLNKSGAPTLATANKKTPSVEIGPIPIKAVWWAAVPMNSWIGGSSSYLDTNNDADEYAIGINNSNATAVYDGCKCAQISLYQTAPGGPIQMTQSWLAQYGDSEKGTPTTFSAPSIDAGSTLDVTNTTFTGATDVMSWTLTLQRAAGYTMYCDTTLYSDALASGIIGGTLTLVQNRNAATVPTTSLTIAVGAVTFTLSLKRDNRILDVVPALLTQVNAYTLIKSDGTYPVTIA